MSIWIKQNLGFSVCIQTYLQEENLLGQKFNLEEKRNESEN